MNIGTRLTIRQLTEHFAYLITSGLSEADIHELRQKNVTDFGTQYMFFNRFFGDNGRVDDAGARQMQAYREVAKQRFGERPCPTWERKLWLRSRGRQFQLGIDGIDGVFEGLRDYGSNRSQNGLPYKPENAREQVQEDAILPLRLLKEEQSYLGEYLNSPTILRWQPFGRRQMLSLIGRRPCLLGSVFITFYRNTSPAFAYRRCIPNVTNDDSTSR